MTGNSYLLDLPALTIHKSKGLTLAKSCIDIGKSERTTGVSYVAISRVKSLDSCFIEPMTYERLSSLKSSANLQYSFALFCSCRHKQLYFRVGPLLSWGLYTLLSTHHAVSSFYKFINIIPFTQSQSICLTRTYLPTSSHVSISLVSQSMVYCLSVK